MGFLDRAIRRGVSSAVSNAVGKAVENQIQGGVDRRVQASANAIEGNLRNVAKSMGARFCTNCGAAAEGGEKFCSNCGTPLAAPERASEPQYQTEQLQPSQMPEHFRRILAEEFPDYNIREGLSAQDVGWAAEGPCKPYDFCLYRSGLKCVIMLTAHNRDNNRLFKNARAACQNAGVPFLNFYTHFPNERGYVVDRIRQALR